MSIECVIYSIPLLKEIWEDNVTEHPSQRLQARDYEEEAVNEHELQ